MAFIVEDGTNVPNANAYVTVEFADSYFEDKGNSFWETLTTEQKQQRIVVATQYIDSRWYGQFKGNMFYEKQSLEFPRTVWVEEEPDPQDPEQTVEVPFMPLALLRACSEYAINVNTLSMLTRNQCLLQLILKRLKQAVQLSVKKNRSVLCKLIPNTFLTALNSAHYGKSTPLQIALWHLC